MNHQQSCITRNVRKFFRHKENTTNENLDLHKETRSTRNSKYLSKYKTLISLISLNILTKVHCGLIADVKIKYVTTVAQIMERRNGSSLL